jgi:hypothetical protein
LSSSSGTVIGFTSLLEGNTPGQSWPGWLLG